MNYDFINFKNEIKKIEEWLSKEFATLHTGRATPAVLEGVSVESYGSRQPLSYVASIDIEDAKTLFVNPWDKSAIKDIEKGISVADLGLSVSSNDQGVRVSFPDLSAERRVALVKIMKTKLEDARVSVRAERERVMGDIEKREKDKEISEDEKFQAKEELQRLVNEANSKLDMMSERKETDIMK